MESSTYSKLKEICREAIDTFSGDAFLKDSIAGYLAEKLERNNVMIMPYKIGDTLYRANSWLNEVDTLTVSMITQKRDGSFKIRMTSSVYKSVQDFTLEEIANPKYAIYASKEEATEVWTRDRKARLDAVRGR